MTHTTAFRAPRQCPIARTSHRDRPSRTEPTTIGVLPIVPAGGAADAVTATLEGVGTEFASRALAWSTAATTWEFALVGVLFVLICALFVLRLSETVSTASDGERARSTPDDVVNADDSTAPLDEPEVGPIPPDELAESYSDQSRVLRLLVENDGRIRQQEIVERTEWSKSKVSRLLSRMEENGTIEKVPVGRENVIRLASSTQSTYVPAAGRRTDDAE